VIEMTAENRSAFAIYQDKPYQIHTREALLDDVIAMLTYPDEAQLIHISIWRQVSVGILSNGQFYLNLIDALKESEQFNVLHTALGISSFAPNEEEVFWSALWNVDKTGMVFGYAVVAAAKTYDLDRLSDEILNAQIANGHIIYNQFVDGMFKEVSEGVGNVEVMFYIFSADGGGWATPQ